jgi:hypothetical protein
LSPATAADPVYCSVCFERLAKQQFSYVDVSVSTPDASVAAGAVPSGYYRLSLGKSGDASCRAWGGIFNEASFRQLEKNAGLG